MANSNYMENGVCGPCLLVEITEELDLYERRQNDRQEVGSHGEQNDGQSVHEGP
ncbi:hypothetical protein SEA_DAUBENSKI_202 [Streptomyces phage Daubenski]|uniref:Uncharacterized protein n=1 Tax=Streptomyces phage Daubenski TaxID=2653725 RepID=A0A5Q2WGD4_9CAUD|nr:hypothetical protein KNU80_gp102 [Streptomyces phage Daubenski]QGH76470.1 hypothetical protein SEA_DAUBENSKI_202 [Streptomyces phage Daubenski]